MQPPLGSLHALEKHVLEHPDDEAALRAWADALLEVQNPLGSYIMQCFTEFSEPPLPDELRDEVLGTFRFQDATCFTWRGVLREVSFYAAPDWDTEWGAAIAHDHRWRGVSTLALPPGGARDAQRWLPILREAKALSRLHGVHFALFTALCEEQRSFDALTVTGQPTAGVLTPITTPRLQVKALTLPGDFGDDSALRWLVGSARPVFDSLEALTVDGVGIEHAQPLLLSANPALLRIEGRHWSASRREAGDDFTVIVAPVKNRLTKEWELTPPPWIPREELTLRRGRRGRLLPLTVTVPAPPQATPTRRHLHVVAKSIPADDACPFARAPWRELVAALCSRRNVEGRIERLQSGAWVLTLRGDGVAHFQRPLPWLPGEPEPLLALLPNGFSRTLTDLERWGDDDPPYAETHGFSAHTLLAHARLRFDANDAVFQLSVYRTWEDWHAAATDAPGGVVARTGIDEFLAELKQQEPIEANAELFVATRLLARARARAEAAGERKVLDDVPF